MTAIILFAVIAALRVIQKIAYKNSGMKIIGMRAFFRFGAIYQLLAGLMSVCAFVGYGAGGLNMPTVICSVVMALLFAVDLYTGIETVKTAPLIVVNMYSLGGLVLSCILSYFLFGEQVSVIQGIGLAVFFAGVFLLTPAGKKANHRLSGKTIFLLMMSFLCNGFVMVTQKYFSLKVEGGNPAMFSFLTFIFNALFLFVCWMVCLVRERKQIEPGFPDAPAEPTKTPRKTFLGMEGILYIYAVLMALALFGINLIITELGKTVSAVILFPISSAISIMITVVVGWLVYKETLSKKAIAGLVLGFLSILLIGIFTPEFMAGLH